MPPMPGQGMAPGVGAAQLTQLMGQMQAMMAAQAQQAARQQQIQAQAIGQLQQQLAAQNAKLDAALAAGGGGGGMGGAKLERQISDAAKLSMDAVAERAAAAGAEQQAALATQLAPLIAAAVREAAAAAVAPAVEAAVAAALPKLVDGLKAGVEKPVKAAVTAEVKKVGAAAERLPAEVSEAVGAQLQPVVAAAFKAQFEATLLPGYEAASQKMFEQLHATFTGGVASLVGDVSTSIHANKALVQSSQEASEKASKEAAATIATAVKALSAQLKGVVQQAAQSPAAGGAPASRQRSAPAPAASASPTAGDGGTPQGGGVLQHFALTMELQQLLTAKEYEKAFALTLGKADAQLLAWLLKKLEPRALFAATTLPQVVLATLATQLVADDLKEDAELKLAWIPEVVGHLQPRDPLVGPKLKGVVGAVQAKLDAKAAAFAGGPLAAPYATAAAVVNYLLSQL